MDNTAFTISSDNITITGVTKDNRITFTITLRNVGVAKLVYTCTLSDTTVFTCVKRAIRLAFMENNNQGAVYELMTVISIYRDVFSINDNTVVFTDMSHTTPVVYSVEI